jgi:branched-subunit amino acid ABC-type transport system permease component
MTLQGLLFQAIDGLAAASGLFFVAAGLSLIFGVTRIVNIAHGSLYMLGTYVAATTALRFEGALGFWGGVILTAALIGLFGAVIEIVLLRRIYRAPELFQLLATFALVLIINDAALWIWGPEDLLGPRAPGLRGAIEVLGRRLPTYNVFLIVIGP